MAVTIAKMSFDRCFSPFNKYIKHLYNVILLTDKQQKDEGIHF